ncbi:hypothetical protein [Kineococcus sp. SYSU DK003]|uniref:hypothetical protein n=1 Tax=Kineococcus sp. SYSU DK003 TaxID=3383124 RepID=UPI003D7C8E4E
MDLDSQTEQQDRPEVEADTARERAAEFRRDAREDPAAAIYPHADLADVDLTDVVDSIVRQPLVVTRQGAEVAVVVSVDFFNRAHAAVELLEDDATAEAASGAS